MVIHVTAEAGRVSGGPRQPPIETEGLRDVGRRGSVSVSDERASGGFSCFHRREDETAVQIEMEDLESVAQRSASTLRIVSTVRRTG